MSVKTIPAGHHTVTPYLAILDALKALEFYKEAFGATESCRLMMPDGRLGMRRYDSVIMLSDEFPEYGGTRLLTKKGRLKSLFPIAPPDRSPSELSWHRRYTDQRSPSRAATSDSVMARSKAARSCCMWLRS